MTEVLDRPAEAPAQQSGNGSQQMVVRRTVFAPMADRLGMEVPKLKQLLQDTVMRGASEPEMAAFAIVANQYGLNPFTKEIHAFKGKGGGIVPIVGIDGWAHIVNAHPQFNGCEFKEDEADDGTPDKTTCTMWVKGRDHPIVVTERYRECRRNTEPWRDMPFRMLRHKSFMQAARIAFSIAGIFDEDEGREIAGEPAGAAPQRGVAGVLAKVKGQTQLDDTRGQTFEQETDPAHAHPDESQAPVPQQSAAGGAPPAEASDRGSGDEGADVSGADVAPPANPIAAEGKAKRDYMAWLAEAEAAAAKAGMEPDAFDKGMHHVLIGAKVKGREWELPAKVRADVLKAIEAREGYFA